MSDAAPIPWWKTGVVYQVYPRSFQDTDGDGVGDLKGVIARLDHFVALGVDAIWLSPIFPSPQADFGYDVADYCGVDRLFGDMGDMDRLIAEAHGRGLKLILDFVPNHSSDQHPWFQESRSSRASPKRDWYVWKDAKADGSPPNNWQSDFGGSSWEWDAATGQYYLHAFLKEQPDVNWRNPELRAAMMDVLRFWFDRGINGFRIDVLWHIVKSDGFEDNPLKPNHIRRMGELFDQAQKYNTNQPEAHEIAAEMRRIADSYPGDRVLIGEIYLPLPDLMEWYGPADKPEVLPFNFALINAPWKAAELRTLIADYEAALPAGEWPNWVLGNHDRPRIAGRVGETQARVAAMLLLTLRGTPTIYYGDEIGLSDTPIPANKVKDPAELRQPGLGVGRDPVRTPMPWDATPPHAGFTSGEPWLPLNADWPTRNVAAETGDPLSMLDLHRRLLALRREHNALTLGDLRLLDAWGDVVAYERRIGEDRLLVALNLGDTPMSLGLPTWAHNGRVLLCTLAGPCAVSDGMMHLRANEGVIIA